MAVKNYLYVCINDDCEVKPSQLLIKKEECPTIEGDIDPNELCFACEAPLKRSGQQMNVMFKGTQEETWAKQQTYFRERAKKHAKSEEAQFEAKKNARRELGNVMGKHKKKE